MAHFDASGTALSRLLPDEALGAELEEQTPPWGLEWPVWKLSWPAEHLDSKTGVCQALEAAVARVDEPLGAKLERVEAGMAPRLPRRDSAVGDAQEEAWGEDKGHRVVDQQLEAAQAHPLEAEIVVDELMWKGRRWAARRLRLAAGVAVDVVGGAQEEEVTEELHPLRCRRRSKPV